MIKDICRIYVKAAALYAFLHVGQEELSKVAVIYSQLAVKNVAKEAVWQLV